SCRRVHRPDAIPFHCRFEPHGEWWERIRPHLTVHRVPHEPQGGDRVVLRIAGSAPAPDVAALAGLPGVELVADPVGLAACYAWADLAVVPLTAGGGTRIKLIEAFANGVPVVATSIGVEGIAAMHGVHLLIADAPAAFADACAKVLADSVLAARLAEEARTLVEARYAHAHGVHAVRNAFDRL
ncbi:MAG TPA: glycosyltransferase family 4 protein, partial [Casimicrobiaceae bacterium]|nr:glycosyltransferase family 4 protein [Casimicrobiaceae bacterium]